MKIKSILSAAACAALVASCSGDKSFKFGEPYDFTLTATALEGLDSCYIYLYDLDALSGARSFIPEALIDSAMVTDGTAIFDIKGATAPAVIVKYGDGRGERATFLPTPGDNVISFETEAYCSGKYNERYLAFEDSFKTIYHHALENRPGVHSDEFQAFTDSLNGVLNGYKDEVLFANIDNPVGYFILTNDMADTTPERLDSILTLSPGLAKTKLVKDALAGFEQLKATSVGQPYTDFAIVNGCDTARLSYFIEPGQYTLVDFWASWCKPCKDAIADLKEQYDDLHARGLNVVGVAVWEDEEATLAWLDANPLPWDLILGAYSVPTDIYAIKGIPTMLLIGPDGTILARSYDEAEVLEVFNNATAK